MTRAMRLAVAVSLGALAPPPARGQTVVALTGQSAPGGGSYTSFTHAVLNSSGQVAFAATLTGSTANVGLFAGAAGAVQSIVRGGDAAPGGGTYANPTSGVITDAFRDTPSLNAAGQVAFTANTVVSGSASSGHFLATAGAAQAVALQGQSPPGTGGNYNQFVVGARLSDSGQLAFRAVVASGSPPANNNVVFAGTAGSLRSLSLPGAGYSYQASSVGVDAAGQVTLRANLLDAGGAVTGSGLYAEAAGSVRAVAVQGQPAPAGGNYAGNFLSATVGSGRVAFSGSLTGGSAASGVFAGTATAVQTVALQGQAAPGGGTYGDLLNVLNVNGSGQVAFLSNSTGGTSTYGVYVGAPGAVQAVAVAGQPAPGGGVFNDFTSPKLNGAGQAVFFATSSDNHDGLYGWSGGTLSKIVRTGDVLNLGGAGSRTVKNLDLVGSNAGGNTIFNDNGLVVVEIIFTDFSSGFLTFQLVPVPEPATVGLAAVAGLGVVRLARRRFRR